MAGEADDRERDGTRETIRERDDLRAREHPRRARSERDEDRLRPGERQRRRRRRKHYRAEFGTVVRDVDRLAYALVRAGASAYVGTVYAVGDLLLNVTDSYFTRSSDRDDDDDDDDDRDAPRRRSRSRRQEDDDDDDDRSSRSSMMRYSSDMYGDLSQAVRDTTDAIADSADEFRRVTREERDRDAERDDDGPPAPAKPRRPARPAEPGT